MRIAAKKLRIPTPEESKAAGEVLEKLTAHLSRARGVDLTLSASKRSVEHVPIPERAVEMLTEILREMAAGNAIAVLPVRQEITTQEAAELMNVSRPYVVTLVEKGELPCHKVGSHRRIPLAALLAFNAKAEADRDKALNFLAAQAQELKLYD